MSKDSYPVKLFCIRRKNDQKYLSTINITHDSLELSWYDNKDLALHLSNMCIISIAGILYNMGYRDKLELFSYD